MKIRCTLFLLFLAVPALATVPPENPCLILKRLMHEAEAYEKETKFVLALRKLYSARVAARTCNTGEKVQEVDRLIATVSNKINDLRIQAEEGKLSEARQRVRAEEETKRAERLAQVAIEQSRRAKLAEKNALIQQREAESQKDKAIKEKNKADSLARLAEASRLTALGIQFKEKDPTLAIQLLKIACDTSKYGHEPAVQQLYSLLSTTDPASFFTKKIETGDSNNMSSLSFSKDRRYLASGSYSNAIRIWNLKQDTLIQTLEGQGGAVLCMAFSPNAQLLATGSTDKVVRIWNWKNNSLTQAPLSHAGAVLSLNFSADGRYLVSGCEDKMIRIWDVRQGSLLSSLKGRAAMSVRFSADGNYVISGGDDEAIKIWDWRKNKLLQSLEGHFGTVRCVNFSADERYMVSGGDDETVKVWDWQNKRIVATLQGAQGAIVSVGFSPDGRYLVSGSQNATIKVWDWRAGKMVHELRGHRKAVLYADFSPDGQQVVSGSCDRTIKIWNWNQQHLVRLPADEQRARFPPADTLSKSGFSYLTYVNGLITYANPQQPDVVHELKGHDQTPLSVGFTSDRRYAASGGIDKVIRLWNLQTGKTIQFLPGHKAAVMSVIFSPDDRYLVSGGVDNTIRVWDFRRNKQAVFTMAGATKTKLQLSTDNALILNRDPDDLQIYRNLVHELNQGTLIPALTKLDKKEFNLIH